MINAFSTLNNVAIQKPQVIEKKNELPQWNGKKVYVAYNARTAWITRIAHALLIALGAALIAGIGTAAAITGGIVLIGACSLSWLLAEIVLKGFVPNEERKRKEGERSFSQSFGCRADYSDLPDLDWHDGKKTVTIFLKESEIDKHPRPGIVKGFKPVCVNPKNHPFIITLYPKDENKIDPVVFVYDPKLKKKTFIFNFNGQSQSLRECPQDFKKLLQGQKLNQDFI